MSQPQRRNSKLTKADVNLKSSRDDVCCLLSTGAFVNFARCTSTHQRKKKQTPADKCRGKGGGAMKMKQREVVGERGVGGGGGGNTGMMSGSRRTDRNTDWCTS